MTSQSAPAAASACVTNGGGDEAQISTQRVLALVDAFLHADHDRAPSIAEVLALLDESVLSAAPSRGKDIITAQPTIG